MNLEIDHVFILVEPGAKVADRLLPLGFEESFGRDHPGQGTFNRRFSAPRRNARVPLGAG